MANGIVKGDIFLDLQPVKLTPDEITEHGDSLAKANIDLEQVEKELANVKKQYASKTAALEASISSHSMFITTKKEWRDVECQWQFDFKKGTKEMLRLDTGELLESQIKVTDNDRQKMLPLSKKKKEE